MRIDRSNIVKPEIIIIGGGFAGLSVARGLKNTPAWVTLLDKHNYHLFQPLLYQVATSALSGSNIAIPIRNALKYHKNTQVALVEVMGIDLERNKIFGKRGEKSYNYLVIATGLQQSYFGNDEFREYAPGLKSLDDAFEIRRRILLAFEEAEFEADEISRQGKLTFVIVGGGPTGVELAGAIIESATYTLPKEFRYIDTRTVRVILVDSGSRLLGGLPAEMGDRAQKDLQSMGVDIRLDSYVTSVDENGVWIGNEHVAAENVIWAAGVQGTPLVHTLGVDLDQSGRVLVKEDLSIPGYSNVFVIGDAGHIRDPRTRKPVHAVAQGAIQMGEFVATIISKEISNPETYNRPEFQYHDKGSMATIGRGKAVSWINGKLFAGFIGWVLWGLVHIMFLIGFHNKLTVMFEWLWRLLSYERGSRLIVGDPETKIKEVRGVNMYDDQV